MELSSWQAFLIAADPVRQPLVPLWAMETLASVFMYAWLYCVGACVGSFLNVVVYRLPRGRSLAHPGSLCPRCGHAIRLWDNIPIFSWLLLRGRCRDCNSPIAPALLVEVAVATIFLAVVLVETRLTGDFPRRNADASRWLISPYETLPFWSAYAVHVVLLTTLLAAALIDFDRYPTPRRLFVPVILLALAVRLASPPGWRAELSAGLIGLVAGLAAGWTMGCLWWISSGRGWPKFAPAAMLAAVGAVAGWRNLLEVTAASAVLLTAAVFILRLAGASIVIPLAGLALVAVLPRLLALDVRLSEPLVWPANYELYVAAACITAATIASLVAGAAAPTQYFAPPELDPQPVELRASHALQEEAGLAEPAAAAEPPPAPSPSDLAPPPP